MHAERTIAVFYHVAHIGTWQAIDKEITAALGTSSLLANADAFVRNECAPDVFEFPTLDLLRDYAATHDACICYLHTKGASRPGKSISDWRACMLYWMVERWRECVAKLAKGYDAVGVSHIDTPISHFQGNFWWANSEYIRKLGKPQDIAFTPSVANQTERHKAEFWLLSPAAAKWYEPYHHRLNPYVTCNPRGSYQGRAF